MRLKIKFIHNFIILKFLVEENSVLTTLKSILTSVSK